MNIFGIGTDIVECLRIAQMIERHGELFINRVYTQNEIEYCRSRKAATQHFAGRWAAKEAALKALGTGLAQGLRWQDIETDNNAQGAPLLRFAGRAAELQRDRGIRTLHLSLSDEQAYVVAFVILEH